MCYAATSRSISNKKLILTVFVQDLSITYTNFRARVSWRLFFIQFGYEKVLKYVGTHTYHSIFDCPMGIMPKQLTFFGLNRLKNEHLYLSIVIQLKRIRKVSPTQGCKDGTEAMLHLRAKRVNVGWGGSLTSRGWTYFPHSFQLFWFLSI